MSQFFKSLDTIIFNYACDLCLDPRDVQKSCRKRSDVVKICP